MINFQSIGLALHSSPSKFLCPTRFMRVECSHHNVLVAADCEQDEMESEAVEPQAVEPAEVVEYCLAW